MDVDIAPLHRNKFVAKNTSATNYIIAYHGPIQQ